MRVSRSATPVLPATPLALAATMPAGVALERATVETPGAPLGTAELPDDPPGTCPVTGPPDPAFVPPAPYPAKPPGQQMFWFGTEKLWTWLPLDGRNMAVRPLQPYDSRVQTKNLLVAKRLLLGSRSQAGTDRSGEAIRHSGSFLLDSAGHQRAHRIPEVIHARGCRHPNANGCWEITGRYKGYELTFVVWVAQ